MPRTNIQKRTESECCSRSYSDEWLNLFEEAPKATFDKSTQCANFEENGVHENSACPAFEGKDDEYAIINENINGVAKKIVKGCCENVKYTSNYPWFNMSRNDCNEGSTIELADNQTMKVDSSYVTRNGKRVFGDGKCLVCDPQNNEYIFCAYCDQKSGFFRVETEDRQVFCKEYGKPDATLPPNCIDWAQPGINDQAGQTCADHTANMDKSQLQDFCCSNLGDYSACESCCATCHDVCKSCPATTTKAPTTADPNACVDNGSWDCSAYASDGQSKGYCCDDGMCEKCCKTCRDAGDCKCEEKKNTGQNSNDESASWNYYSKSDGQLNGNSVPNNGQNVVFNEAIPNNGQHVVFNETIPNNGQNVNFNEAIPNNWQNFGFNEATPNNGQNVVFNEAIPNNGQNVVFNEAIPNNGKTFGPLRQSETTFNENFNPNQASDPKKIKLKF